MTRASLARSVWRLALLFGLYHVAVGLGWAGRSGHLEVVPGLLYPAAFATVAWGLARAIGRRPR